MRKIIFAKKVEISAQHIEWLKENQTLLNILLNYCTLHGASGGDVASKSRPFGKYLHFNITFIHIT